MRTGAAAPDRLWDTVKADLRNVRRGARPDWRRVFRKTIADLEEFYLTSEHRQRLALAKPPGSWFLMGYWLLRALLLKLTPARRGVLLAALLGLGMRQVRVGDGDVHFDLNLSVVGSVLLIGVLLLELKDKLVARGELQAGRAVQQSLMSERSPALDGWDLWMFTRPANDVGGDLVDSLPLGPGRVGLALADVAGKALPAALLMAKVQATLRALASETTSLKNLAARTNEILCRDGLPNRFATLVYLDLRADCGSVSLLNAGHMPPVLISPAGVHQMPLGNIALGMMPGAAYVEQTVDVAPGEMLLVYSDGLTEALNESGEFFGDPRLFNLLPGIASLSAFDAGTRLLAAVDAFIGESRPFDDLSLLVLKRRSSS